MGRLLVASAVEPGTFVWFLGFEFVTDWDTHMKHCCDVWAAMDSHDSIR